MDLHLVVDPIMSCGIQLFGIVVFLKSAYIWSEVPKDVFPNAKDQQKARATSLELPLPLLPLLHCPHLQLGEAEGEIECNTSRLRLENI